MLLSASRQVTGECEPPEAGRERGTRKGPSGGFSSMAEGSAVLGYPDSRAKPPANARLGHPGAPGC